MFLSIKNKKWLKLKSPKEKLYKLQNNTYKKEKYYLKYFDLPLNKFNVFY